MKKNTEKFSQETQRELTGLYIPLYDDTGLERIIPSEEPLTAENFGIVMDGHTYTTEDFRWYEKDGSDRDLVYDDSGCYFDGDDLPDEVFCLLNTVICLKFAKQHMADAKAMVAVTDNDEAKQAINEAFIEFENLDDATESIEKLQIACDALSGASDVFEDIDDDLYNTFYDASGVISEVISELDERSYNS